MQAYLVSLEGQGDQLLYLVGKEIWDWILSPLGTPTPSTVLADLRESNEKNYPAIEMSATINETSGSYENDRAIQCPSTIAVDGKKTPQFYSMGEYTEFMQNHPEIKLVDTYNGYIY